MSHNRSLRDDFIVLLSLLFALSFPLLFPNSAMSAEANVPITLKSDTLQYLKEKDLYLATGSVSVEQGSIRVESDSLSLVGKTGEATVVGHVHFFDAENHFEAERVTFNLETKLGVLYKGKLFIKEDNYHIEAEQIVKDGVDHYAMENASFTTCDCQENPSWRFRSDKLDLTLDEYLSAKQVFFYIRDVPVLYLPYLLAPIKRDRSTGLLIPHVGFSTRDGFQYQQDFFWAISKSQDATLSYEYRGERGIGGGLEYRYTPSKTIRGELRTHFFRDKTNIVDRWDIYYKHEQQFSTRVNGRLDIRFVNENDTFSDLSNQTADRARQNVESNLFFTHSGDSTFVYLLSRYTQDLRSSDNNSTFQRLPEIGANVLEYRLGDSPLYFNFESTAVNFWSEGGLNLQRLDLYPKLALPIQLTRHSTLNPWLGFRETWYDEGLLDDRSIHREIFPMGLHLSTRLSTIWGDIAHQIHSEIFYENVIVREHGAIRQIDELDGLHDRQTITASIGQGFSTLNTAGHTEEKGSLRLSATVHVNDIAPEALSPRHLSDLRAELVLNPWSPLSLRVDTFYDPYQDQINSLSVDLEMKVQKYIDITITRRSSQIGTLPKKGDLFNPYYLGDREVIGSGINFWSEQITVSTPWGVKLLNMVFYDADQNTLVEADYILEYQSQCWDIRLSYLDFHDRNEFSFLITLRGLGGITPQ